MASRASGFWTDPVTTGTPSSSRFSSYRSSRFDGNMKQSDSAEDYFRVAAEDEESEESDAERYGGRGDLERQEGVLDAEDGEDEEEWDGRTPLDKTIDKIGMGSYQWTLLSLCGLGWMADNMWIQAVAIILPRVQRHYDVPDSYIGAVSSSMFGGMMVGAVGWGTCSDLMGRITAFNATLFLTAIFGIVASFSNSFVGLCVSLFFLGSSVGGSMPTDGTLLLEHMPKSKQYLVTALSVFFSFGAVLSAVVALVVIPGNSCMPSGTGGECDPGKDNLGWKYLLTILALLTLFMFLARMVFFRLHESPRYLVHAGRPHDAIKSLQLISRFNGEEMCVELDDVRDHQPQDPGLENLPQSAGGHQGGQEPQTVESPVESPVVHETRPRATSRTIFDASIIEDGRVPPRLSGEGSRSGSSESNDGVRPPLMTTYAATGETPALDSNSKSGSGSNVSSDRTLVEDGKSGDRRTSKGAGGEETGKRNSLYPPASPIDPSSPSPSPRPTSATRPSHQRRRTRTTSSAGNRERRRASVYERRVCWSLPSWLRRPLWAWWDRVMMVLSPEWMRTTLLVWGVWWGMSLAYTMFNVFLPKLLETGAVEGLSAGSTSAQTREGHLATSTPKTLEQSLWDVVIFTIGGCPGAILGAWLIESRLGRKWSLAGSTFITAFFCVIFAMVEATWATRASTVGISLSATAMWAVLYGWTPEIFGTKVRGTACGIASALSRIGGMIAPILGGILLMISHTLPVYTSVVVFVLSGVLVLLLKEMPRGQGREKGANNFVH